MAITYTPVAGEAPTIDPDDARGPWTINLPDTSVNGFSVTLKIWPAGTTPITVTALGAGATVEDPTVPGTSAASIQFGTIGVGSAQWIYNLGKNLWGLYGGAAIRQTGRGSMLTAQQAISDITAAWVPVSFTSVFQPPHGMTLDAGTGQFTFEWPGWWEYRCQLNLAFTETQNSREVGLRIYNVTDANPGPTQLIPVGRNQAGFLINVAARFLMESVDLGDDYRLEIGGGDTLSGVVLVSNSLNFLQITPSVL